jgi:hypothetical protein
MIFEQRPRLSFLHGEQLGKGLPDFYRDLWSSRAGMIPDNWAPRD